MFVGSSSKLLSLCDGRIELELKASRELLEAEKTPPYKLRNQIKAWNSEGLLAKADRYLVHVMAATHRDGFIIDTKNPDPAKIQAQLDDMNAPESDVKVAEWHLTREDLGRDPEPGTWPPD
jgi:hypothetical protein